MFLWQELRTKSLTSGEIYAPVKFHVRLLAMTYLERMFDHELRAAKTLLGFLHLLYHILNLSPLLLGLGAVAGHSEFAVVLSEIGNLTWIRSFLNQRRQLAWRAKARQPYNSSHWTKLCWIWYKAEPQWGSDNPWPSEKDAAGPLKAPSQNKIARPGSGASPDEEMNWRRVKSRLNELLRCMLAWASWHTCGQHLPNCPQWTQINQNGWLGPSQKHSNIIVKMPKYISQNPLLDIRNFSIRNLWESKADQLLQDGRKKLDKKNDVHRTTVRSFKLIWWYDDHNWNP